MALENSITTAESCQVISLRDYCDKREGYDVEDGHTRLINVLWDRLADSPFTARQYRVIASIIRKTYGYQKKADRISVSQISEHTKLPVRTVSKTLSELKAMNVITRTSERGQIGINKYVETWDLSQRHEAKESKKRAKNLIQNSITENSPIQTECAENSPIKCAENSQTQKKERNKIATTDVVASSTQQNSSVHKTNCPYQTLADLWRQHFANKTQPKTLGDRRKRIIRLGWQYALNLTHSETGLPLYTDTDSGVKWWDRFMAWVAKNAEFCMKQQHNFTIDWLFTPKAIEGLIDGKYNKVGN